MSTPVTWLRHIAASLFALALMGFLFNVNSVILYALQIAACLCLCYCSSFKNVRITTILMATGYVVPMLRNFVLEAGLLTIQAEGIIYASLAIELLFLWCYGILHHTCTDRSSRSWIALVAILNLVPFMWFGDVAISIMSSNPEAFYSQTQLCHAFANLFSIIAYWHLCHSEVFEGRYSSYAKKGSLALGRRYMVAIEITIIVSVVALLYIDSNIYSAHL